MQLYIENAAVDNLYKLSVGESYDKILSVVQLSGMDKSKTVDRTGRDQNFL